MAESEQYQTTLTGMQRIWHALKRFFSGSKESNCPSEARLDGGGLPTASMANPQEESSTGPSFIRQPLPSSQWAVVGMMQRMDPKGKMHTWKKNVRSGCPKIL